MMHRILPLILCLVLASNLFAQPAKININAATPEQLQALPGIGPALAKNIVEHRTRSGKFAKIEELLNVKGIGEKRFAKLKNYISVN